MSYSSWFEAHGQKHKNIMKKLEDFSDEEVIKYFRFVNMVEKEPDFCLLYKENKKCHEMEVLNCYFVPVRILDLMMKEFQKKGLKYFIVSVA